MTASLSTRETLVTLEELADFLATQKFLLTDDFPTATSGSSLLLLLSKAVVLLDAILDRIIEEVAVSVLAVVLDSIIEEAVLVITAIVDNNFEVTVEVDRSGLGGVLTIIFVTYRVIQL